MDMTETTKPRTDQLNADDFISGSRNIKVTGVKINLTADMQPVSVSFEGDNGKPYKPCLSMRRVMVRAWEGDTDKYAGRSMTLYCDDTVVFGGVKVGGIRISHMSHIKEDLTFPLTISKARRSVYHVKVLRVDMPVEISEDEFNEQLKVCADVASMGLEALQKHWVTLGRDMQRKLKDRMESQFKPDAQQADDDRNAGQS